MPTSLIERGRLTDLFLEHLRALLEPQLLVGDSSVPELGGWIGQPQSSVFRPTVTLRTGVASPNQRETLTSRHTSWQASYSLRTIGALRNQADAMADLARAACLGFRGAPPGWNTTDAVFNQLGAVVKVGNDENATFEVDDTVQLWIERQRG